MRNRRVQFLLTVALWFAGCARPHTAIDLSGFTASGNSGERIRVLDLYPGVTATLVAPANIDPGRRIDLILYALPNGNTTAQTIGRKVTEGLDWHFDIQHIGAQTRALRTRGYPQAIVAYLEADSKSWPSWRSSRGYERANARIAGIVDQIRNAIGNPGHTVVTLTGHSGGGSFMFGFIEAQDALPSWLERIAFLDANYSFEPKHGEKLVKWLRQNPRNTLVVLAYDDRNIMLDGKKVVSETGGTWRASERMVSYLRAPFSFTRDTLDRFIRFQAPQVEILMHPNPANRILHTEMIGEMNGYMHAMLVRRPDYRETVLKPERVYTQFVEDDVKLPPASAPDIPERRANAITGAEFIKSVARLSREEREDAIRRELLAGNIPSFLRRLRAVEASAADSSGIRHAISYDVMPDYLAIGSDRDFVRIPMTPYTAQAFCDAFGFILPTSRMVNDIWAAATTHLDPRPLTIERESPLTFLQHHQIIEAQLKGVERGTFVAGIKKDVVLTNKLLEKPQRVAIYGWHYPTGKPIQPVYAGHVDWYVDYSHGIRPVRRSMRVDGAIKPFEAIMKDPQLRSLISDEGEITALHYDR
jgi:hypothetical protein